MTVQEMNDQELSRERNEAFGAFLYLYKLIGFFEMRGGEADFDPAEHYISRSAVNSSLHILGKDIVKSLDEMDAEIDRRNSGGAGIRKAGMCGEEFAGHMEEVKEYFRKG